MAGEPVDTSNIASIWLSTPASKYRMYARNVRTSSGITRGDIGMPETAPLVYPDTGYAEIGKPQKEKGKPKEEAKSSCFSQHKKVAAANFDQRAQAKYVRFCSITGKVQ